MTEGRVYSILLEAKFGLNSKYVRYACDCIRFTPKQKISRVFMACTAVTYTWKILIEYGHIAVLSTTVYSFVDHKSYCTFLVMLSAQRMSMLCQELHKFQFPSFGFDRRLQGKHYSSQINRSKAVERHF